MVGFGELLPQTTGRRTDFTQSGAFSGAKALAEQEQKLMTSGNRMNAEDTFRQAAQALQEAAPGLHWLHPSFNSFAPTIMRVKTTVSHVLLQPWRQLHPKIPWKSLLGTKGQ